MTARLGRGVEEGKRMPATSSKHLQTKHRKRSTGELTPRLLREMAYPETTKCLRFEGLPGSEPAIVEKDVLPLPTNEILVKVHAASINPCDIQLWRSGLVAVVAGDKGMGKDFSGTVVAVGEKVTGWAEGDEIFGLLFHIVSLLCQSPNVTDTW